MRDVDRQSVPVPDKLQNLTDANKEHLIDHTKISNSVYAHNDVKRSLQMLYFDKCYICEGDISSGAYDVEHYLPKKKFPHLGYTWENLHKACSGCNLAKEKNGFFFNNEEGEPTDIKLLDPSNPNYSITNYLKFNINSMAEEVAIGTDPTIKTKSQNTVHYLNGKYDSVYGKELAYLRSRKANLLLYFCNENLNKYRERLIEIKRNIDSYTEPQTPSELEIDENICQSLINADNEFFSDRAPFSTATRAHLFPILKINYEQLVKIKQKMKLTLNL